jgi:hypothetical protein
MGTREPGARQHGKRTGEPGNRGVNHRTKTQENRKDGDGKIEKRKD